MATAVLQPLKEDEISDELADWARSESVEVRNFGSTSAGDSGMSDTMDMYGVLELLQEEADPRPEDDGFLIKQLLVNLSHQVAEARKPPPAVMFIPTAVASGATADAEEAPVTRPATAEADAEVGEEAAPLEIEVTLSAASLAEALPPPIATEKLLGCFRRVLDATYARRVQVGLQGLVLSRQSKAEEQANIGGPRDNSNIVETSITSHNDFWQSYRDRRMNKWEGQNSVQTYIPSSPSTKKSKDAPAVAPEVSVPAKGHAAQLVAAASCAASLFPAQREKSSATAFTDNSPAFASTCSSAFGTTTSADDNRFMIASGSGWRIPGGGKSTTFTAYSTTGSIAGPVDDRLWKTLSNFPRGDGGPTTDRSAPSTMLPFNDSFQDCGSQDYEEGSFLDTRRSEGTFSFASLEESVHGPSTRLPRARTPPTLALPEWRQLGAKRRMKHLVKSTLSPEFRINCPMCTQASCQCVSAATAVQFPQKVGRPRLKATHSRLTLRPLELEATTSLWNANKRTPMCGAIPLLENVSPTMPIDEEDEKDLLCRPKALPTLYEGCHTASSVQSEQWKYFAECQRLLKTPKIPPFLLRSNSEVDSEIDSPGASGPAVLDISMKRHQMNDKDLLALIQPLRGKSSSPVRFDFSRNDFTDAKVASFFGEIACQDLRSLNLSYCGAGGAAISAVGLRMAASWTRLQVLQLAGCRLPNAEWKSFCERLTEHGNLVTLDLADTSLGCMSEVPVESLMKFITSVPYLQHLDISGNYISYVGFELLGAALKHPEVVLKTLDVSHNAAMSPTLPRRLRSYDKVTASRPNFINPTGEPKLPEGELVEVLDGQFAEDLPNFNPVMLLCEALDGNKTLLELRLASSFIDSSSDFALLNSLLANTSLKRLDLSGNPHGIDGLRYILRILAARSQSLENCNITGFRDRGLDLGAPSGEVGFNIAVPPSSSTSFIDFIGILASGEIGLDLGAPSGSFKLELCHPQHRAIVRWLLNVATQNGISIEQAFTKVEFKKVGGKKNPDPWFCKQGRGWGVALSGKLKFDFDVPLNYEKLASGAAAVEKYVRSRRVPVTLKRFSALLTMFGSLDTLEQKSTLITAMSDTLLLKTCHVCKLLQACPKISDVIVRTLFGHLLDTDRLLLFDLLTNHNSIARMLRKDARTAYFFNDKNPTDRYSLNLLNSMERSVAARLQVISYFEAATAQQAKKPDVSQYGNYEGARNLLWESENIDSDNSLIQWTLAERGTLTFDYVSAPHCGARRKAKTATDSLISDLARSLEQSMCCAEDKLMALRSISENLVLTPAHVRRLCEIFPNPDVPNIGALRSTSQEKKASRMETYRKEALCENQERKSAFQFRFSKCRVEAFVCLFNRCVDPPQLCTSDCLFDSTLFGPGCVSDVCERLGRIRTFDVMNCSKPLSASVMPSMNSSGMSRMARTLKLLKEAERVEGLGASAATEIGRRYELDLSVFEEWACARFLVGLSQEEQDKTMKKADLAGGKGCLRNCYWSEKEETLEEEDLDFIVPASWLKVVPDYGELQLTYVVENPECISESARGKLAEKFFGWEPQ